MHDVVLQVGAAQQNGAGVDVKRNVALKEDAAGEKPSARQVDRTAARCCGRVDRCLDGGGIERLTVAFGAYWRTS